MSRLTPSWWGWTVVVLFFVIGALIRAVNLESNPPGLWQDEASTGLDAWLIWHTGRDRTGTLLPLIFRSFGDYPLGLYRYLTAPVVGLAGLTIGNQRVVASLFGTLLIAATAVLTRICTDDRRATAVIITGALCPTWILFSRYGSEAILLPATLTFGWLGIEYGVRAPGRHWAIWLGAVSLGLSAYTYHAVKLVLPLWMIGFLVYQWPSIQRMWAKGRAHFIGPAILFAAIVLPSAVLAFSNAGQARGRTVLAWYHHSGGALVRAIAHNYLSYFDPAMLFIRGGPTFAQSIPGLGMWNFIELPLIIIGLAVAFRAPATRRFYGFVLFLFLLGPLPGGVTYEAQNMGRAIAWLPAPQILSATGLAAVFGWALTKAKDTGLRRVQGLTTIGLLAVGWVWTTVVVALLTLVHYPRLAEREWQFEVSRALQCAKYARDGERIIISRAFPMPALFARFHLADELLVADKAASVWRLGDRKQVGPGELYLVPARQPQPDKLEPICTVAYSSGRRPAAYVYRGEK